MTREEMEIKVNELVEELRKLFAEYSEPFEKLADEGEKTLLNIAIWKDYSTWFSFVEHDNIREYILLGRTEKDGDLIIDDQTKYDLDD